jgi:hypothetical protein
VEKDVAVEPPGHSSTKLTYADYELFPDDGLRHEIIDGEHYVTVSPMTRHQQISRDLLYFIQSHFKGRLKRICTNELASKSTGSSIPTRTS